jgi:hypothetical protein
MVFDTICSQESVAWGTGAGGSVFPHERKMDPSVSLRMIISWSSKTG